MKCYNFDVHGMTRNNLIRYLEALFEFVPLDVADICIIHGYNKGSILKDYLRDEFENKRVIDIQEFGQGRTIIRLKGGS